MALSFASLSFISSHKDLKFLQAYSSNNHVKTLRFCKLNPSRYITSNWRRINIDATSMLIRRHFNVVCPLGCLDHHHHGDIEFLHAYWSNHQVKTVSSSLSFFISSCKDLKFTLTSEEKNVTFPAASFICFLSSIELLSNLIRHWCILTNNKLISRITQHISLYYLIKEWNQPEFKYLQMPFYIFLIFPRKYGLIIHANHLCRRWFAWIIKPYFLGKKNPEKNQICLSSAGSICSALWDKEWWYPDRQDKTDGVTLNLGSNPITFPEALIWRQETG